MHSAREHTQSMTDILPTSEILELIKGQARLETKIDTFFSAQIALKDEVNTVKSDISAVKADVAEIKTQRRVTMSNLAILAVPAGGIAWLAGQIAEPVMKKFLGG